MKSGSVHYWNWSSKPKYYRKSLFRSIFLLSIFLGFSQLPFMVTHASLCLLHTLRSSFLITDKALYSPSHPEYTPQPCHPSPFNTSTTFMTRTDGLDSLCHRRRGCLNTGVTLVSSHLPHLYVVKPTSNTSRLWKALTPDVLITGEKSSGKTKRVTLSLRRKNSTGSAQTFLGYVSKAATLLLYF